MTIYLIFKWDHSEGQTVFLSAWQTKEVAERKMEEYNDRDSFSRDYYSIQEVELGEEN